MSAMFVHYIKTTVRALRRRRVSAAVNVVGLTLAFASTGAILVFTQHELSYDRFHENLDRTYRVIMDWEYADGRLYHHATTAGILGEKLREDFAAIEGAVRVLPTYNAVFLEGPDTGSGSYEEKGLYTEPQFFDRSP